MAAFSASGAAIILAVASLSATWVYNVPEGATTVPPSQPVVPGAAPTVPAQASVPQASANFQTASPVTQEQFDMMVARMWFECSLAFILIE
ncbi:hypothetical protein PR001_g23217 [Phytophthora rubi]|uniref:RxLR effector protein n=1 Tax=Phytophthora rubi TaxID=129364 RepID=A0A6A3ITX9_9STRA|nr:hypothetical protein PR001_g23217 [Phytophthora rubi]